MLRSVQDTARWTNAKIAAIRDLVDTLFEQPYCRIGILVEKGIAKRQAASVYLKNLVEIDVLTEQRAGRENCLSIPNSCNC